MTEKSSFRGQDKNRKFSSRQGSVPSKGPDNGAGKSYKRSESSNDNKSDRPRWERDNKGSERPGRAGDAAGRQSFAEKRSGDRPPWKKDGERSKPDWKPRQDKPDWKPREDNPDRKPRQDKPEWKPRQDSSDRKPRQDKPDWKPRQDSSDRKPRQGKPDWKPRQDSSDRKPRQDKPDWKPRQDKPDWKSRKENPDWTPRKEKAAFKPKGTPPKAKTPSDGKIRLNKFIANSGVCSRREADMLITAGAVSVNGKIVNELGTKIDPADVVVYDGQTLTAEKKVYVLLNKPKDFITTLDDPQGRRTVMELVNIPGKQRLFPVGRLDRNTTGLLLLTNDGELTKRLTHPKYGVSKLYHVVLDKALTRNDMQDILKGVEIDGQQVVPDALEYAGNTDDKTQIGIELHSGQNRVVRRIFESLDYQVVKLDRVMFAGLTKKDLPRGHWRYLSEKEVNFLRMIR